MLSRNGDLELTFQKDTTEENPGRQLLGGRERLPRKSLRTDIGGTLKRVHRLF